MHRGWQQPGKARGHPDACGRFWPAARFVPLDVPRRNGLSDLRLRIAGVCQRDNRTLSIINNQQQ
jgi:hypothetical protein